MPRSTMTSTRTTTSILRGVLRTRSGAWMALFAAAVLGACSSDSGAGPREEDTETADFRFLRPGTVRDLAVESVGAGTVTLRFTETHDGLLRPALYEIRYSPTPMKNGWNTAKVVSQGSCAAPLHGTRVGQTRTCTVEGLSGSGSVDFQMMAYRPYGSSVVYGQLSNVVTAQPSDLGGVSAALKVEGDNQTGIVGTELPVPLSVRVKDASGNGISGVSVSWSANRGGGSVSSATSTTDSDGIARVTRTLGTVRGENRTTAYVSGASPVEFVAMAEAGPVETVTVLPAEVSLNVGDSTDMVALLEDRYGNRISGVAVTWASSDASVAPVRSSGRVLGAGSGVAGITASVDGAAAVAGGASALAAPSASAVGGSTVRVLDEVSNTPSSMTAASGAGQSGTVGRALAQPFVVEVRNSRGERVQGASVAFEVTNGGGSVSAATATTGSDGRAGTTLTLGTVAGTNEVRALVDGVTPVTFSAAGQPGPVASVSVSPGSSTIQVGGTAQLVAALRDQHGNLVDGSVTWSSSNAAVVAVNTEGLVGGAAVGSATIRATSGSFSAQASVTVQAATSQNPGTVADLAVSGSSETSLTLRFTSVSDGTGNPANYQIRYAPTPLGYGWGSATEVTQGTCAGVVTSSSVGQTVSCTVQGLSGGRSYDFQMVAYRGTIGAGVTFGNLSNVASGQTTSSTSSTTPSVASISITPSSASVNAGSTVQLSAVARDVNGNIVPNVLFAWSSSATSVAQVNGAGLVTGVATGSATIRASAAGLVGSSSVTVSGSTTTEPPPPPPSGGGSGPFSNEPAGFTQLTDNPWSSLNHSGWSYNARDAYGRIASDPSDENGSVLEYIYPAGFESGRDPAAVHHYGVRGRTRFFIAFTTRFSSNWTWQDPGMKFAHLMGNGWNMHLDVHHPNPAWTERYGPVAGEWAWAPTGWSGIGAPNVFNNVNRTAARATIGWQTVEVLVDIEARVLRQWVNGVLTADHRNVPFPSGSVENFHFAGTWGGGNIARVPQDQWLRIGRTYISAA